MTNTKHAIIVQGTRGSGKTPAIKLAAGYLATYGLPYKADRIAERLDTLVAYKNKPVDITAILYFVGCVVGIHSDCDAKKRALKNIQRLCDDNCQFIICAAHGKQGKGTISHHKAIIDLLKAVNPPYTITAIKPKPRPKVVAATDLCYHKANAKIILEKLHGLLPKSPTTP